MRWNPSIFMGSLTACYLLSFDEAISFGILSLLLVVLVIYTILEDNSWSSTPVDYLRPVLSELKQSFETEHGQLDQSK